MPADDISDEVLMARFRDAMDEGGFRLLADRHYERALRVAQQRLGNFSTAQDAVQEALIRVVRHRRRYRPSKPFAPWFYTILRNVCTDLQRREARQSEAMRKLAEVGTLPFDDDTAGERVAELLAGLPERDVQLLRLRFDSGLSLGELAGRLECSAEAMKKRLQRLMQRIRPAPMSPLAGVGRKPDGKS